MIFEITQDYQIFVPLMVANLLSFAISRRYQPVPIYSALLEQEGIHLTPGPGDDATGPWNAGDLARRAPGIPAGASVDGVWRVAEESGRAVLLVTSPEQPPRLVAVAQLAAARLDGQGASPVSELALQPAQTIRHDAAAAEVMGHLSRGARLIAIVDDDGTVLGGISAEDVVQQLGTRGTAGAH
jgi:hypothetical protein